MYYVANLTLLGPEYVLSVPRKVEIAGVELEQVEFVEVECVELAREGISTTPSETCGKGRFKSFSSNIYIFS